MTPSKPLGIVDGRSFGQVFRKFSLLFILRREVIKRFLRGLKLSDNDIVLPEVRRGILTKNFSTRSVTRGLVAVYGRGRLCICSRFLDSFGRQEELIGRLCSQGAPFHIRISLTTRSPHTGQSALPSIVTGVFRRVAECPLRLRRVVGAARRRSPATPALLHTCSSVEHLLIGLRVVDSHRDSASRIFHVRHGLIGYPPRLYDTRHSFITGVTTCRIRQNRTGFSGQLAVFLFGSVILKTQGQQTRRKELSQSAMTSHGRSARPARRFLFSYPVKNVSVGQLRKEIGTYGGRYAPFTVSLNQDRKRI